MKPEDLPFNQPRVKDPAGGEPLSKQMKEDAGPAPVKDRTPPAPPQGSPLDPPPNPPAAAPSPAPAPEQAAPTTKAAAPHPPIPLPLKPPLTNGDLKEHRIYWNGLLNTANDTVATALQHCGAKGLPELRILVKQTAMAYDEFIRERAMAMIKEERR